MSWSVAASGKASAVAARIEEDFSKLSACVDPEEGVKQAARDAIAVALAAQDPATVVKVSAFGSQSTDHKTGSVRNQLSVFIEPEY